MRNWVRGRRLLRTGSFIACIASVLIVPAGRPASAASICKGERLALVIGNSAYPDSEVPLKGTVEAAKRVADALRSVGFDVELGEDLTKAKTESDVTALLAKIKPGAAVFLFFSGFGLQAGGHTYLLPVDSSIWSEADIVSFGLNIDRFLNEVEEKKASVEVLVIDAARRNPFERRFRPSGSSGLAPPSAMSGNLVALFSAPPGKVFDPNELAAEPFADDVAREVSAPHATAQEAFRQVRALVARTSRAGQAPWGFSTLSYDLPLDVHDCSGAGGHFSTPAPVAAAPQPEPRQSAKAEPEPPQPAAPPKPQQTAKVEPPAPVAAPAPVATPPSPPAAAPPPGGDVTGEVTGEPETGTETPASQPPAASPTKPAQPKEAAKVDAPQPAAPPSPQKEAAITPPPPPPTDEKTRPFQVALQDTSDLDEVRQRLFEQNFDPGPAGSDKLRTAIVTFEQQAGLPDVDKPTLGLLEALRSARSLSPWGAITVANDVKRWGMSWDKPTRALAVAEAKSRCGTRDCSQELTFHGQGCGAFALSPKHWIVAHRDGGDAARKAALSDCNVAGATCRVIGSVCADGSDKTD